MPLYKSAGTGAASYRMQIISAFNTDVALTAASFTAAVNIIGGSQRHVRQADLTSCTEARLVVRMRTTGGNSGSTMWVGYVLSSNTNPQAADFLDITTTRISVALNNTHINLASAWQPLVSAARADVLVSAMTVGGDAVATPNFGEVAIEFR